MVYIIIVGREVNGSGFCRLLNTRSNNCWDGSEIRTDDIDDFDDDDIIDQGMYVKHTTCTHKIINNNYMILIAWGRDDMWLRYVPSAISI